MAVRITNYFIHPADNRYYVFVFREKIHADYFENLLHERNIEYERHYDDENDEILFGVHKQYKKETLNCNFLAHAKFRRPFIRSPWVKYILLIVTFAMTALAIAGYFLSR